MRQGYLYTESMYNKNIDIRTGRRITGDEFDSIAEKPPKYLDGEKWIGLVFVKQSEKGLVYNFVCKLYC